MSDLEVVETTYTGVREAEETQDVHDDVSTTGRFVRALAETAVALDALSVDHIVEVTTRTLSAVVQPDDAVATTYTGVRSATETVVPSDSVALTQTFLLALSETAEALDAVSPSVTFFSRRFSSVVVVDDETRGFISGLKTVALSATTSASDRVRPAALPQYAQQVVSGLEELAHLLDVNRRGGG